MLEAEGLPKPDFSQSPHDPLINRYLAMEHRTSKLEAPLEPSDAIKQKPLSLREDTWAQHQDLRGHDVALHKVRNLNVWVLLISPGFGEIFWPFSVLVSSLIKPLFHSCYKYLFPVYHMLVPISDPWDNTRNKMQTLLS